MNRVRWITALLFGTLILCCFPGAAALARSAVDVDHDSAMTVVFRNTTKSGAEERVSRAEFRIYRIADIDRVSDYHWSGDFIDRKENFREMTQERWKELAETLWQEVRSDPEIQPLETKITDGDGSFSLEKLRTGLYLLAGPETGNHRADGLEHEYYTPVPCIVSLPDLLPDDPDEVWQYSTTVYPKLTYRDPGPGPDPDKVILLLQKKWSGGSRRDPVTIRLLRDNEVYGEYTVSELAGWQCRVELSKEEYDAHEWSISEIPVSGYSRLSMLLLFVTTAPERLSRSDLVAAVKFLWKVSSWSSVPLTDTLSITLPAPSVLAVIPGISTCTPAICSSV